jgi:hypothetical protein
VRLCENGVQEGTLNDKTSRGMCELIDFT